MSIFFLFLHKKSDIRVSARQKYQFILKRTGIIVLLVLLILIGVPIILLNTSYFQQRLVDIVTKELSQKTGAKIYIEDSDINLFRGIVFHHVQINDSLNHQILRAKRLDAGVRIFPLLQKRVELDALRLIDADIRLSRKTPESELNIQPIIDAFIKKPKKTAAKWYINFSSIVMRNCRIRYDVLSQPSKLRGPDVNHLDFSDFSAKIGLKISPNKHYQFWIDKLTAVEKCGLRIDKLKLQAKMSPKGINLKDFVLRSAGSTLEIDELEAKYKSFSAFSNFADSVKFGPTNIRLNFVPADFACLNTSLANLTKSVSVAIALQGKLSDLTCQKILVNMEDIAILDGRIALKGLPEIQDLFMSGQIEMLHISPEAFEYFSGAMTHKYAEIPALRNLGTINYMGRINTVGHRWILTGDLATAAGNLATDLQLSQKDKTLEYQGKVKTDGFQINVLYPDKKAFGKVAFDLSVKGINEPKNGSSGSIEGSIPHFYYNGYDYQNISLNGSFDKKSFEGKASIDDANAKLDFSGMVDFADKLPKFKGDIYADNINLRPLNLASNTMESGLSFHLRTDFEGRTVDELLGKISVDSLDVYNNQKWFHLKHMDIVSGSELGSKHILITSPLLSGEIWGTYKFSTLTKSLRSLVRSYFPSLLKPEIPDFRFDNNFDFHCKVSPSPELESILNLPFSLQDKLDFQGFYNDKTGKFRVRADAPKLLYGKVPVQSVGLLFENPQKEAKFLGFAQIGTGEKEMKLNLDARSLDDNTALKFNISNSGVNTYSGDLQSDIQFSRRTDGELQIKANLKKSSLIINDSVWQIHPTDLRWEDKRLFVKDFQLTHSAQFIKIQGFASENSSDTLSVLMNSFSLDDLFLLLPKEKTNINFGGLVSGHAECVRLLKDPAMNADLSVDNFSFNQTTLGHLTAKSQWNNSIKALVLDATIRSNMESEGVHRKVAEASGAYFPSSDSLFLSIDADRLPLGFLDPYLGKILNKLDGVASGNAHLIGPVKHLGIYAKAYVENASFGVQMLNTRYYFSDSILLSPRIVVFRNVQVKDKEGNIANATGIIRHNHFKNMQTSIDIQAKNILAMDIPASPEAYFYGKAYGTGTVSINGPQDKIMIDVNMRTEDKTKATISFLDNTEVAEYSFINFIQKKKVNEDYDLDLRKKRPAQPTITTLGNLTVNLQVEATPNAELTLITDPSTGDEINGRGSGAIRAVFNQANDIQLFGRYTIESGSYKFIYENLLRRDFKIENGGSITFSGDPFAAELDIKANYTVNANLSDLLTASDLNALNLNRTSIPVNCVLKLNGELQKPGIQLDLAYPSADDDLKRRIADVINTDEMMNQQIVFLMLFGRFSTPTYSTTETQSSTSNWTTALNTTISTLSSQLNRMINEVFGKSKMSFDFDYRNAAYELGTPGEWKVGMSGQWLDNRLTFKGNLGSREDLTQTNKSQFIGEFDFNLKFKNSEKWSAKFFNRANDNRYFKSALNTQGMGIVYKEDYNHLTDLFKQMVEGIKKSMSETRKEDTK